MIPINDEQYKLLSDYRFAVTNVITDTNILTNLDTLAENKSLLVNQEIGSDIDIIFNNKLLNTFRPKIKKDATNNVDMTKFSVDMKALYEKLKTETDPLTALKEINKLAADYFYPNTLTDSKNMVYAFDSN